MDSPQSAVRDWMVLDNAAKIYPSVSTPHEPAVFRVSVTLNSPIRVSVLADALERVLLRCPYFQVSLKRGLFWYYLQRHTEIPGLRPYRVEPGLDFPASHERLAHLMRVRARDATIAVDFSHILTDGRGGLRFLGTLVCQYLALCGVEITEWEPFLNPATEVQAEEYEDAYGRFFKDRVPSPPRLTRAYHLPGSAPAPFRVISGRMPIQNVLQLARRHRASLNEYLVALHLHCLAEMRAEDESCGRRCAGVLRLEVPIDMRRFFPSGTMRNFSLFVSPEIDRRVGDYTLEETIARVHNSMQILTDPRELRRQIARNVGAERNPFVRVIPLAAKDVILSLVHGYLGQRAYSGVLSNLGWAQVPTAVEPYVREFGFVLHSSPGIDTLCSVVGFADTLKVSFSSRVTDRELERLFFSQLAAQGLQVCVTEERS